MSKNIWICSRTIITESEKNKLYKICDRLTPDNINPAEPIVEVKGNIAFAIINPTRTLMIHGNSLLMGKILDEGKKWYLPFEDFPDGSYALYRDTIKYSEIISDSVASRTIWYLFNNEFFIASTSQRAIIMYVGSFDFNRNIIPWMLSTGSLGPSNAWDKRIHCLPPNSSIILDKKNWSITNKSNKISFKESRKDDNFHEENLRDTLFSTFSSFKIDYDEWVLPLSGGYDSRGILCLLLISDNNAENLKTITWGLKSSDQEKQNDAYVANKLSREFNLYHQYFHTDFSDEPIKNIIDRFLQNGEGRIDHISGYMDGFKIWKILYEEGIQGIIRGDEGFGWEEVFSPLSVRLSVGLGVCSDYLNLKDYAKYNIPKQELPEYLDQRADESLEEWRDRLYHEYRIPTILAALSDLKLSYVEIVNPLLFSRILQEVRTIPNHLRTEKKIFKKIVTSLSPNVKFATASAIAEKTDIFKQMEIVEILKKHLSSNYAKSLFHEDFLNNILENIKANDVNQEKQLNSSISKEYIKKFLPRFLKDFIRGKIYSNLKLDYNLLAFRIYIIIRMHEILTNESLLK